MHEPAVPEAMRQEQVPIPAIPPGIGPVEQCAMCKGPVDMSDFHLTYDKSHCERTTPLAMRPIDVDCLAVVCKMCRPSQGAAVAVVDQPEPAVPAP
jgi:hypothetical protein